MCRVALVCMLLAAANVTNAQEPEWVFAHGPFSGGNVVAVHPDGDVF